MPIQINVNQCAKNEEKKLNAFSQWLQNLEHAQAKQHRAYNRPAQPRELLLRYYCFSALIPSGSRASQNTGSGMQRYGEQVLFY